MLLRSTVKKSLDLAYQKREICFYSRERFLSKIINKYGKHPVSTDGGTWYSPQTCKFLKLIHYLHSLFKKIIIRRTVKIHKRQVECFDDYFSIGEINAN